MIPVSTVEEFFTHLNRQMSNLAEIKTLPPGSECDCGNLQNAMQFALETALVEDRFIISCLAQGILRGHLIYLGNKQLQLTQLGYLYIDHTFGPSNNRTN